VNPYGFEADDAHALAMFDRYLQAHKRHADALIEIAASFRFFGAVPEADPSLLTECNHCERLLRSGCRDWCPGLLARRALGVA